MTTHGSIGILGGTGALGRGLAYRWARAGFEIIIGSRDLNRATEAADELRELAGGNARVSGSGLRECAESADIVVLAVPWAAHDATLEAVGDQVGQKILVNVVVPLEGGPGGLRAVRPEAGSVCALAQEMLPDARVVGGFHHVSYVKLQDVESTSIDCDVLLVSDDDDAIAEVRKLVETIPGMRGVHAGKLSGAFAVEGLTANLISMNRRYKTNAGIRVTGIA